MPLEVELLMVLVGRGERAVARGDRVVRAGFNANPDIDSLGDASRDLAARSRTSGNAKTLVWLDGMCRSRVPRTAWLPEWGRKPSPEYMMNEFPIRRVDRSRAQSVEPLGTKPKFWFRDHGQRMLFKADDRETGEDWAEVVASELCTLLGLPHVEYELAVEVDDEVDLRPGVVCANMARKPIVLVLGNELLLEIDPGYPSRQRFRVSQHTIAAVSDIVAKLAIPPEVWMRNAPSRVQSALDAFSGYLDRLATVSRDDVWGILEKVPEHRMTDVCREFTMELLMTNQQRLLE